MNETTYAYWLSRAMTARVDSVRATSLRARMPDIDDAQRLDELLTADGVDRLYDWLHRYYEWLIWLLRTPDQPGPPRPGVLVLGSPPLPGVSAGRTVAGGQTDR